jgi:1-acyl-sn-glycerol-3-phosphate acyltransferase
MWCKKRHKVVIEILRLVFSVYYFLWFGCRVKKQKLPEGGAIVVANHVTTLDPVLVGLLFDKPLYYMTSKHVFQNRVIGKLLKFLVNPIPKEKINKSDIAAIKACMQIARENGSICIFPEGNRTFSGKLGYVDPAITKLIKRLGKPLIVCNILGGYGTDPRWCNGIRRGKMQAFVKKIYSCDEMQAMTNEQLYDAIVSDMTVDEFAGAERYCSRRRAECLESVAFICPICGAKHTIYTKKQNVYCTACGMKLTYNEDQTISDEFGKFPLKYVYEWYDYQLKFLQETEFSNDELIFADDVEVYKPELGKKKELIGTGEMQLYGGSLRLALDSGDICLNIEEVDGITLIGNRIMDVYSEEKTYRVRVAHKTNILKYLHAFYIIRSRKLDTAREFVGI